MGLPRPSRPRLQAWERAAERFLAPWKLQPDVQGAFLTGSRILGTAAPRSDVDIVVILDDATTRMRSCNRRVGGYMIECITHTSANMRGIFRGELTNGIRMCARQIVYGRIVFDRAGAAAALRREAVEALRLPIPATGRSNDEADKQHMATALEKVEAASGKRSPGFWLVYYTALPVVAYTYARYLCAELAPPGKLWSHLTDRRFRSLYRMPEFPDRAFAALLVSALRARSQPAAVRALSAMVARAHRKMGGFQINRQD